MDIFFQNVVFCFTIEALIFITQKLIAYQQKGNCVTYVIHTINQSFLEKKSSRYVKNSFFSIMPLIFLTRKHLKMWAFQKLGIPKCCYLMKNANDLLIGYQQTFFCNKNNLESGVEGIDGTVSTFIILLYSSFPLLQF